MARIASLDIIGKWIGDEPSSSLMLDFIDLNHGTIIFDGMINGMALAGDDADDVEVIEYPAEINSAYITAKNLFASGKLLTIDCQFLFEGKTRRCVFRPLDRGIRITFIYGREVFDDGVIDFNWHYKQWVPKLRSFIKIEGVEFSDFI